MFWKKKEILNKEIKNNIKEEWDCTNNGHEYRIVDFPSIILFDGGEKPKSPTLMMECKHCHYRQRTDGCFWNELPILWQTKEIGYENYKELDNFAREKLKLLEDKWNEKQKSKKSSTKKIKK